MKNILLFFVAVFALGCAGVQAQVYDSVVSIETKIANQGSYVTGYSSEFKLVSPGSDLTWTAKNFNNNNSSWDDIRCGSKSGPTVATITTDFAIASPINEVEVEVGRYKPGNMTSMALLVSPNADMSESTSYAADISALPEIATGASATITIPITEPAENMYYQLKIEMPQVYSEGVFSVNSLKYFYITPPVPGVHTDTLDFTNPESIQQAVADGATIEPGSVYAETGTNNLNGVSFVVGDVRVTLSKADGTIVPRWWEAKTISPELRLNPDNVMTFEIIKPGSRLMSVKFLQGNSVASYYDGLDTTTASTNLGEAEFSGKEWVAPEHSEAVEKLTLTFHDYCRSGGIRITYFNKNEVITGIDAVGEGYESDCDATEYFTLQGVRVSGNNMMPGVYIVRHGSQTRKVILK